MPVISTPAAPSHYLLLLLTLAPLALIAEDATHLRGDEEPLQWTPYSVTVIKKAEIERTFRRTLEDLQGYVPGMVFDRLSSTPQGGAISIRGITSSESSKGFEPAVAVTVDGIYVGTHTGQNQSLFDLEQVEIVRGPEGTFSGMPAEGGAIHLRRTRPTGELGLETRLAFGDFNRRDLDVVLNFPVTASLAGKVSGTYLFNDNSDFDNTTVGRRENREERTSLSASLLLNLENLEAQYTFDIEDDDSDTPLLNNYSVSSDLTCVPDPVNNAGVTANCVNSFNLRTPESITNERSLQNFSNARQFEGDYHTLRLEGDILDHHVTSLTGIRDTKEYFAQDLDATSADVFSRLKDQDYSQVSTDLRIAGERGDFKYTVGGYLMDTDYTLLQNDLFVLDTLNNADRVLPEIVPGQVRTIHAGQDAKYLSVFGYGSYTFDDQWILDGGLRALRVKKDFSLQEAAITKVQSDLFPANDLILTGRATFEDLAGSLGFSYRVDDGAMVYGRYSIAHTPGGFHDNAVSAESAGHYNTSTTQGLELGMKSLWLDDRLQLNMAIYNNYQEDRVEAVLENVSSANIESTFDNVSDLTVRGFDLEIDYEALDNLHFRGTWGHINADHTRFVLADLTNPGTKVDRDRIAPRAPADSFYLTSRYSFAYWEGQVNLFAGYRYVKEYYSNPTLEIGRVRPFTNWDLSAEYVWQDFTFRLFSQNVNNKVFIVNVNRSLDADITSVLSIYDAAQGIATVADVNRPRYTGFEVKWVPGFLKGS